MSIIFMYFPWTDREGLSLLAHVYQLALWVPNLVKKKKEQWYGTQSYFSYTKNVDC